MYTLLLNFLDNDFPTELIKLINSFICDCEIDMCSFCDQNIVTCCLKRCVLCTRKSCCMNKCPDFKVNFIIGYAGTHKELKCCHKCQVCKDESN